MWNIWSFNDAGTQMKAYILSAVAKQAVIS